MKKLITLIFLLTTTTIFSQVKIVDEERFSFEFDGPVNSSITSPEDFLGHKLGESYILYADIVRYIKNLAEQSPRVVYNEYGKTYEGRTLINIVLTSEENHAKLEELRTDHLKLLTANESEAQPIIENAPVFTSLSYNIHGNETSTSEAALQTAYHLAASNNNTIENVLKNSVIIMFICINPDGRDRYVYWYKSVKRNTFGKEPRDLEHYAPWPNGRTNHYWFDLNRDWIWGIHPESRGQTIEYQKWMPQVHVDYHEQGYNNNYFTMPGTTPRNKLLPDTYEAWSDTFGRANIREFDKYQLNYFTRNAFDFFYPGYGSSYPTIMGAIGMLTEQGGIGSGRGVETNDGYVLTLRQRIFDHYKTSMATIKKSAERKQELLKYSHQSWNPTNSKTQTKAYLFDDSSIWAKDVVNILLHQGIKVKRATADFTALNVKNFRDNKAEIRKNFPAGTFIVETNQPRNLFITTIMERNLEIEDSVMYDMSTWSAPIAYNLDAYTVGKELNVNAEEITEKLSTENGISNPTAQYAFVIEWKQRFAPKALAMLWEKGYRVRVAEEPFSDGKNNFGAGTLIVLRGRNLEKADKIEGDMREIAEKAEVKIVGLNTGRMAEGMDLAAGTNPPVKQPKVALMVEPPFNTYTTGQIYFLFDFETGLPVERIRTSILQQTAMPKFGLRYGAADLNDYDVLILAGGGNNLAMLFGEEQIEQLKAWVSSGGVLIAYESATNFFTEKASKMTKVKIKEVKKDSSDAVKYLAYKDREDYFGKKRIPGSALNAKIDITNPLAFGMDPEVYTLKFGYTAFEPSADLISVGHYDKEVENLLVAGYASKENLEHLAGQTFAGFVQMGRGKIVLMQDNVHYRMFWRGPSRMMQNAVMLLKGF